VKVGHYASSTTGEFGFQVFVHSRFHSHTDTTHHTAQTHAHQSNPNMLSRKKCRILPPIVSPSGSRRTLYANMRETAALLTREFEHLKDFLYVELATTGSVDGDGRLLLKGRFRVPQIQSVLTSYARQYVICANCGSPNTKLNRDPANRLWFLKCSNCQSQRAVTTVRTGFRATMRGQRRAARNASAQ